MPSGGGDAEGDGALGLLTPLSPVSTQSPCLREMPTREQQRNCCTCHSREFCTKSLLLVSCFLYSYLSLVFSQLSSRICCLFSSVLPPMPHKGLLNPLVSTSTCQVVHLTRCAFRAFFPSPPAVSTPSAAGWLTSAPSLQNMESLLFSPGHDDHAEV